MSSAETRTRRPRAAAPIRRSQQERRDTTQALLLDATIACLAELGYAGTSLPVVCHRAGVSRGAQTHHFPTKTALVVAAVGRLTAAGVESLDRDLAAASAAPDALEAFLAGIWRTLDGPLFETALELLVAARTDPELSTVWQQGAAQLSEVIETHVDAVARSIRPRDPLPLRDALHLSVFLVQAFALDGVMRSQRRTLHRRLFDRWSEQVRAVAFAKR